MSDVKATNNNSEKPLSRFWACFFSCSIFGLLWTQKISKTRKWIPIFTLFILICFVLDYMLYPFDYDENMTLDENIGDSFYLEPNQRIESFMSGIIYDYFPDSGNLDDEIFLYSLILIVLYHFVIFVGSILVVIYFMLKWVTKYNLDNFGYKSKREWKKANISHQSIIEKIKQHASDTSSNIKDVGKKIPTEKIKQHASDASSNIKDVGKKIPTEKIKDASKKTAEKMTDTVKDMGEKIPTEKIKDTSKKTAEKMTDTVKNLKPKFKMSEDDKRKQIREWHDMLKMGVITESDFEKKKSELLKIE